MPIPSHADTDEIAQVLGIDDRSVRRLQKQGILQRSGKGFPVTETIKKFIQHRERAAEERAGTGAYGRNRALLVGEQAKRAKHIREVQEGNYILVAEMIDMCAKVFTVFRNQAMSLPVRAAPRLVALKSPMEAQAVLDPMVRDMLTELAEMKINVEKRVPKKAA